MVVIKVEIISDILCAWCYIGKRRLERAIELFQKTYPGGKDDVFIIKWLPYYLNHHLFPVATDKGEVAKIKLAGVNEEKRAAIRKRVDQVGRSLGINFSYGGKIGPTRDAHRIIYLAQEKYPPGIQNALVDKFFEAYHELEMDISDKEVVHRLALEAGVSDTDVESWLRSDLVADVVDEEARKNKEIARSGVPMFFLQGQHQVDGAQDPEDFFEKFVRIREDSIVQ